MKYAYYRFQLIELNGEFEYRYDYLVKVKDEVEAKEVMIRTAKNFYPDKDAEDLNKNAEELGVVRFYWSTIFVKWDGPYKTTKKEFVDILLNQYQIV